MTEQFIYSDEQMDAIARAEGTYLTLMPFLAGRTDLEEALLLFVAEHHGVTAAVQLLLSWENEAKKWHAGEGVFQ